MYVTPTDALDRLVSAVASGGTCGTCALQNYTYNPDTSYLAWQNDRNAKVVKVDWRFTTADARIMLKHLYPVIHV